MWLGVCGGHPGERMVPCACLRVGDGGSGLERVFAYIIKMFSNALPQWLVSFKRNNIASYKFLVNV